MLTMINLPSEKLRVSDLPTTRPTRFKLIPDDAELRAIADELGLLDLRKLRFEGEIRAEGRRDWRLKADLGATVVQACVVSLEPVNTRIDEKVNRLFVAELPEDNTDEEEVEMPEDDSIEALGKVIDPAAVMVEALSLALPLYPRAKDAELDQTRFTEPGKAAMTDEETKPFAGLAALRDKLDKKD
ncbi:YceD family protein [Thalassovita sp.]|uniref:YceD family protein n=1 Tax=Thalassovita sp. TaxID=1979401 RepID=UPI003A5C7DA0